MHTQSSLEAVIFVAKLHEAKSVMNFCHFLELVEPQKQISVVEQGLEAELDGKLTKILKQRITFTFMVRH